MAENKETTILEIKVDTRSAVENIIRLEDQIKDLKNEEAKLKKEVKEGTKTQEEASAKLAEYRQQQAELNAQKRAYTRELQTNIRIEQQNAGSIAKMRAELAKLTSEYDRLSEADRESEAGKAKLDEINTLTDRIKGGEEATQRFQRTVGDYEGAIKRALGSMVPFGGAIVDISTNAGASVTPLGAMKMAISAATQAAMAFIATPIGATIAAIAAAFAAAKFVAGQYNSAIESSERLTSLNAQATAAWHVATEKFNAVRQRWAEQEAQRMMSVTKGWANFLRFIGAEDWANEIDTQIALEEKRLQVDEKARAVEERNATSAKNVAKLRTEAKDRELYTAEERLAKIREANKIEEQSAREARDLAKERYEIALANARLTENTKETNDEISRLFVEMEAAEMAYYNKTRELKEQENTLINEIKASKEEAYRTSVTLQTNEINEINKRIDLELALMAEGYEKQRAMAVEQTRREIEELKRRLTTDKDLTLRAREEINRQIELKEQLLQKNLAEITAEGLKAQLEERAKTIQLSLSLAKKGSAEELSIILEGIFNERDQLLANDELTNNQRLLIQQNYQKKVDDAITKHNEEQYAKEDEERKRRNENEILEMQLSGASMLQILKKRYDQRVAELTNLRKREGETDEEFRNRQLEAEWAMAEAEKEIEEYKLQVKEASVQATTTVMGAASDLLGAIAGDNKALAVMAKAIALGEIAVNTGLALARGIAAASAVPFPANIPAIATTVATIMANITAAIKTVKSAKFADGGYVSGEGTATSDSINARLSNGESVANAQSTSMFWPITSALNVAGGGSPIVPSCASSASLRAGEEMLARSFARGAQAIHLSVAVSEIREVEQRVSYLETLGDVG